MPATNNSWNVNADGDWATAADWSLGTVPDSNNNVIINTTSIHTITHNSGNDTVNNLSVGNDHFAMNGGSLAFLAGATFSLDYQQNGGTLLGAGTVSITGAGSLLGGVAQGTLAFQIGGTIQIGGNYSLGGSDTLTNNATTNQTGAITLGDNTGVNATITNASTGSYTINGDYGVSQGAASASIVNSGSFGKTAGTGTSLVDVNFADTGTVSVATGLLEFRGPSNSFSGTISGAGQFALGGGSVDTFASGTMITTSAFGLYDSANLTLGGNLTYANTFNEGFGSVINLNGHTLTLSGPADFYNQNFGTPTVNGSGTLTTSGATTMNTFILGGSVNWSNTGTVSQISELQVGDGSSSAATFTNQTAGKYNIASDTNIERGSAATSTFVNAGTLAKTAGSGTSYVDVNVVDTGTISVATGTLDFRGSNNSFSGVIGGAGQFALDSGSVNTFAAGTTVTATTFSLYGDASLTLGGNLTYVNTFNEGFGTTINLNGHTLALSGPTDLYAQNFGVPTINGSGTLTTSGATTVNDFILGGTVSWNNSGVITQDGTNQIGDAGSSAATLTNQSSGQFNISNDTNLEHGAATTSLFVNAGTLAKTAGSGTSYVDVSVTDTGTVSVASGTLDFRGASDSFGGTISGAGQFALDGGTVSTIASGTSVTVSTFDLYSSASLTLGGNLTYANTFNQGFGTSINLNAHTLTLSGATDFYAQNFGTPTVNGSGTLATSAATSVNGFTLGGSVSWSNTGTVTEIGNLQIGDSGSAGALLLNQSTGHYNIANDSGILQGAAATSAFHNAGIFSKTAGVGSSAINVTVVNTGTISVASGTLDIRGLKNNFGGTISGSGTFLLDAGSVSNFASGLTMTVSSFNIYGPGTTLTLGGDLTYANAFDQEAQTTISLAGHTLTLSGAAIFHDGAAYGLPTVNGSGTLATSGTTTMDNWDLGGTVNWSNSGTVSEIGSFQIGDSSAAAATLTNTSSGHFNITNDSGITLGTSTASSITNAGAFTKTGGTGTSVVGVKFNNTGTVEVQTGSIDFTNAVTGAGTMKVDAGATLELGSSVASGTFTYTASTGTLRIDNAAAFNGSIKSFVAGDVLDLGGQSVASMTYTGTKLTVNLTNNTTKTLTFASSLTALQSVTDGSGGTDIIALPTPYALTSGTDNFAFASGTNNVTGTSSTLTAGDSLTGGTGVDTLTLSGGGNFNLSALAALSFDNVNLAAGANYTLTLGNTDLGAASLSVTAGIGSANTLNLNASAVTSGHLKVLGGYGADTIVGGGASDTIDGRGGNDILTGGSGANTFYFDTALNATTNDPTITNLNVGVDNIELAHTVFTALTAGALPAADFTIGTGATTSSQHIIYNSGTGALSYDSDGSGSAAAVQFATLSKGLNLTASSFSVA